MGRILAIDYGAKRVGVACTDELKLIATGLITVSPKSIFPFLKEYTSKEEVECFVVGDAKQLNNEPSESARKIGAFVSLLKKTFPQIPVRRVDERFTSKIAFQSMIDSGLGKEKRRDKELVDMVSATILLQDYLELTKDKSDL